MVQLELHGVGAYFRDYNCIARRPAQSCNERNKCAGVKKKLQRTAKKYLLNAIAFDNRCLMYRKIRSVFLCSIQKYSKILSATKINYLRLLNVFCHFFFLQCISTMQQFFVSPMFALQKFAQAN